MSSNSEFEAVFLRPDDSDQPVAALLNQAQAHFANGNFSEAADCLRQALMIDPSLAKQGLSINLAHSLILATDWVEIAHNLIEGTNYLEISGWLYSLVEGRPVNADFEPIPWYTYPAIDFIEDKIQPEFTVFEFGSGNSTLWWAGNVKQVISVENDPDWFTSIKSQTTENANLFLIEDETEYAQKILVYPDNTFDVIVVDGINRNECAKLCHNKLKPGGFIIFDNTDDAQYDEGVLALHSNNFQRIDFYGLIPCYPYKNCTSIFFKDNSLLCEVALPSRKKSCLGRSCLQTVNPSNTAF